MLVGITGGPACGKSAVTRLLRQRGAEVFSADEAARAVLTYGGPVYTKLVEAFGSTILSNAGELNRAALGRLVFADAGARERLNRITHPAILRLLHAQLFSASKDFPAGTIIAAEVPLLFETNIAGWFERIIVVAASESTQIARLKARNGMNEAEARDLLAAQWPIQQKILLADYVVWNEGSKEDLDTAVARLWDQLKQYVPGSVRNCQGKKI
jgi:dephospho-CoA kinase